MANEKSQFNIGIDLGTTNSSLAYIPAETKGDPTPELFTIPQWENESQTIADARLPSFLWLLNKSRQKKPFAQSLMNEPQTYLVGRLAKEQALNEPLEIIHSAKSWLSVGKTENRTGKILPWGSPGEKLSPLDVQTALLKHIKDAWNLSFPAHPLSEQRVVITVPASFDELAQRLTLQAAKAAGLAQIELIEEPVAAFYDWSAREKFSSPKKVLVCDIGGGTADFSLLSVSAQKTERLRVSDHLLLGGDNIDLGLTHKIAKSLSAEDLPRAAYNLLFAQVRVLKERALANTNEETFHVSIPLESGNLFGKYLSGSIPASEMRKWILEDFFPSVDQETKAERATGLQTWGLPYAKDTRVTAHLAEFLAGEDIDALLCVGGTLIPELLSKQILSILQSWQKDSIERLTVPSGDLAIAYGAARFAHKRSKPEEALIHSPYPRDVTLEVETLGEVLLIPKGHPRMTPYKIHIPGLHLRLNEEVKFQIYSLSGKNEKLKLPSLVVNLKGEKKKASTSVELESIVRETGVLEVLCHAEEGTYTLDFALETKSRESESSPRGLELNTSEIKELKDAAEAVKKIFHKQTGAGQKPEKLTADLEDLLKRPRDEWTASHLRGLWPVLESTMFQRNLSPEHEAVWFYLAGFSLRPGFGYQGDDKRIQSLIRIYDESFRRVDQQAKLQIHWWILWRRVAGGLSGNFQQKLFDRYMPIIRKEKDPPPELIRLLGSLERLDTTSKIQLGKQLISQLAVAKSNQETRILALARLASRYPVYAPPANVLAPSVIEEWADELISLKLPAKAKPSLFFAWAGRMRGDKHYDIDPSYRTKFLAQIDRPEWQTAITEVLEVDSVLEAQMMADSLPTGFFVSE
ncbi:MAG: Hsp70 family protein [Bdellovibrionota bacterium]